MNVIDLPRDIFLIVLAYLSPKDLISIRRVSRSFRSTFTNNDLCCHLVQEHYPLSQEGRLAEAISPDSKWDDIFSRVACRYHHLSRATPASSKTFPLAHSFVLPAWSRSYSVAPWQRHLFFEEKNAPFHYPDTLWTYDVGLLVFPCATLRSYAIYDLETRITHKIDIESESKIVRRIRLKKRVLLVEWCEPEAYHQLNESEVVHRHFATVFDLLWDDLTESVTAVFRNEMKVHFLGIPLNSQDRFFSAHDDTHYVLYIWQPNRSAWGEDKPIESVVVWDITSPSSYRPSQDPTGEHNLKTEAGPKVIKRLSFADLDFYNIRQRDTPTLHRVELDAHNIYIIEENHRWMSGNQANLTVPRLHKVKTTCIPFHDGPRWESCCRVDGDSSMSFCTKSSNVRPLNMAPCWRHEEFPYLTVAEVVDAEAGVVFSARQCFKMKAITINIKPSPGVTESDLDIAFPDDFWQLLLAKGKICGEERWLIGENAQKEVVILYFDRESGTSAL